MHHNSPKKLELQVEYLYKVMQDNQNKIETTEK